jgi:hydrogenase maturation protease
VSDRALVAGVGNLFFGDDGFGVEVARRLAAAPALLPAGVAVEDFGIRGLHLAYRLLEPLELLVVADLVARGGPPGTLYVLEPDLEADPTSVADGHGMNLPAVFAAVRAMGGVLPRVLLVGCEAGEVEEQMGLSAPVAAAVGEAATVVCGLLYRELETAADAAAREVGP